MGGGTSTTGVSVGFGGKAVAVDAAEGEEVGPTVGREPLVGSSLARVSVIGDTAGGNSREHASSMMVRQAIKTVLALVPTQWRFAAMVILIRLEAGTDQGRTPMRNFLVPHTTQIDRVAARPFFIVTGSISVEPVLVLHLTQ